jgi:MFS family permease
MGWLADRYPKKYVMTVTYFIVAFSIPLLLKVTPDSIGTLYVFAVVFGFAMGADYMLIPLMAAEQFGVNSLARAMSIILPTDTIGQTWCPFVVALIAERLMGTEADPDYVAGLLTVFALAVVGAIAIALMPKRGREDEAMEAGG